MAKARCQHGPLWYTDCPWCAADEEEAMWELLDPAYAAWRRRRNELAGKMLFSEEKE